MRVYRKPDHDPRNAIYKQLLEEARIAQNLAQDRQARLGDPRGRVLARGQRGVRHAVLGLAPPLTLEEMLNYPRGRSEVQKTDDLLAQCGDVRGDWAENETYYRKYKNSTHLSVLHDLQSSIIEIVTTRAAELATIKRRIRGHKQSVKFQTQVNSRWKALDLTVSKYNKEIDKSSRLEDYELPRKLSVDKLKKDGISNDEVWDLDRMFTRSDWAALIDMREGFMAVYRVKRAKEEKEILKIHIQRFGAWLMNEGTVLYTLVMNAVNPAAPGAPYIIQSLAKPKLLERLRMIRSMLRSIKGGLELMTEELRNDLLYLQEQVKQALLTPAVEPLAPLRDMGDGIELDPANLGEEWEDNDNMGDGELDDDNEPHAGIEALDIMEQLGEELVKEDLREEISDRAATHEGGAEGVVDIGTDSDGDISMAL